MDLSNLDGFDKADLGPLLEVKPQEWLSETQKYEDVFRSWGSRIPAGIWEELDALRSRLEK